MVLKQRSLRVEEEDISHWQEDKQSLYLQEFKEKERKKGFDLSKDILTRLTLFRTGAMSYCLIWSYHHITMDGWCLGIIFKELLQVYYRLKEKQAKSLEREVLGPVTPYRSYIRWLERQDKTTALCYWRTYLEGYEQPSGLPQRYKTGNAGTADNINPNSVNG